MKKIKMFHRKDAITALASPINLLTYKSSITELLTEMLVTRLDGCCTSQCALLFVYVGIILTKHRKPLIEFCKFKKVLPST